VSKSCPGFFGDATAGGSGIFGLIVQSPAVGVSLPAAAGITKGWEPSGYPSSGSFRFPAGIPPNRDFIPGWGAFSGPGWTRGQDLTGFGKFWPVLAGGIFPSHNFQAIIFYNLFFIHI
jgi:hypothetical protein